MGVRKGGAKRATGICFPLEIGIKTQNLLENLYSTAGMAVFYAKFKPILAIKLFKCRTRTWERPTHGWILLLGNFLQMQWSLSRWLREVAMNVVFRYKSDTHKVSNDFPLSVLLPKHHAHFVGYNTCNCLKQNWSIGYLQFLNNPLLWHSFKYRNCHDSTIGFIAWSDTILMWCWCSTL